MYLDIVGTVLFSVVVGMLCARWYRRSQYNPIIKPKAWTIMTFTALAALALSYVFGGLDATIAASFGLIGGALVQNQVWLPIETLPIQHGEGTSDMGNMGNMGGIWLRRRHRVVPLLH